MFSLLDRPLGIWTRACTTVSYVIPHLTALLLLPHRQAIDALALCDVDGRMFLEMDEEDLAESDELGLDVSESE